MTTKSIRPIYAEIIDTPQRPARLSLTQLTDTTRQYYDSIKIPYTKFRLKHTLADEYATSLSQSIRRSTAPFLPHPGIKHASLTSRHIDTLLHATLLLAQPPHIPPYAFRVDLLKLTSQA